MDERSYSSFSFCEEDPVTAPPPSFATSMFLTPGGDSERVNDVEGQTHIHKIKPARLKAQLDSLAKLQSYVSMKRSQLRELRMELGFKREDEVAMRAAFMKKLNAFFVQGGQDAQSTLAQDYERLQSLTEEYLELERSYHAAEDELGGQEYELLLAMEQASGLLERASAGVEDDADYGMEDFHEENSMHSTEIQPPMAPSMIEYLQRLSDIEILQERLCDLDTEFFEISDKQETRKRFNIPMDDDSISFLSTYQGNRDHVQKEIEDTLRDVHRLRTICQDQGLIPHDLPDITDDPGLDDLLQGEEHKPDPLKLTAAEDPTPFFEPHNTTTSSTKFDRSVFVNKWILHQLRHSSFQIARLKSFPELRALENNGYDEVSISRLALDSWFMDDAVVVSPPGSPVGSAVEGVESASSSNASTVEGDVAEVPPAAFHGAMQHTQVIPDQRAMRFKNSCFALRRKSEPIRGARCWVGQDARRFRSISCGIL